MKLDIKPDILDLDKINHDVDERISGKKLPAEKKVAPKTAKPKTFGDLWRDERQATHEKKPLQFHNSGGPLKMKDAFKT